MKTCTSSNGLRPTSDGLQSKSDENNVFYKSDDMFYPSSFLFLLVRPGAPSSVLAPSSDARSP